MERIQEKLDFADSVATWFLDLADTHGRHGQWEEALKCANMVAWILAKQNRTLSCGRLEATLRSIAQAVPAGDARESSRVQASAHEPTCLHVLSEALPAGGITALATRWMKNDRTSHCIHSVVLLTQRSAVPEEFSKAVSDAGGQVYVSNPTDSLLEQALWLRSLARDRATYVILHVAFTDIITCSVAFGVPGGPPILLVNHAANLFWPGTSIADLVINIRGSDLEKVWTAVHRGIPRTATIPIPLVAPEGQRYPMIPDRANTRDTLHIPANAVVMLTVGAHFKYLPTEQLDFVAVFEDVMTSLPNIYLIAVGFEADRRWREAAQRLRSRIKVLGVLSQSALARLHGATDIYVEGFPFGTTTALLEAGIKGIPVVLAPAACPPPYGSDGVALDGVLQRARTMDEYKKMLIRLAKCSGERKQLGHKLSRSIAFHHTGSGWNEYLACAIAALPGEHRVYCWRGALRTSPSIHEHWSALTSTWNSPIEETFDNAVVRALSIGLRPQITDTVRMACRRYRSSRIAKGVPIEVASILCNRVSAIVPTGWVRAMFRTLSVLSRPQFLRRATEKLVLFVLRGKDPRLWYEDYRQVGSSRWSVSGRVFRRIGGR